MRRQRRHERRRSTAEEKEEEEQYGIRCCVTTIAGYSHCKIGLTSLPRNINNPRRSRFRETTGMVAELNPDLALRRSWYNRLRPLSSN